MYDEDIVEFARLLQVIKGKSPEAYRHIVGLIRFFTKK